MVISTRCVREGGGQNMTKKRDITIDVLIVTECLILDNFYLSQ